MSSVQFTSANNTEIIQSTADAQLSLCLTADVGCSRRLQDAVRYRIKSTSEVDLAFFSSSIMIDLPTCSSSWRACSCIVSSLQLRTSMCIVHVNLRPAATTAAALAAALATTVSAFTIVLPL